MNSKISEIRKNYSLSSLDIGDIGDDPISFFQKWFEEAVLSEVLEVNAMTLATATKDGKPNARIVLLKEILEDSFVFIRITKVRKDGNWKRIRGLVLFSFGLSWNVRSESKGE